MEAMAYAVCKKGSVLPIVFYTHENQISKTYVANDDYDIVPLVSGGVCMALEYMVSEWEKAGGFERETLPSFIQMYLDKEEESDEEE